jgi:hypothetical protein
MPDPNRFLQGPRLWDGVAAGGTGGSCRVREWRGRAAAWPLGGFQLGGTSARRARGLE